MRPQQGRGPCSESSVRRAAPSCAEGPETREPAQIEASEPQFSPDNIPSYYSRLRVIPANKEAFTVKLKAHRAPAEEPGSSD